MGDLATTESFRHRHLDIACSLGASDVVGRLDEWRRLCAQALGSEEIEGGRRLWLATAVRAAAADLARRESECCGFLDFDLVREGRRLRLDVTSPVPDANAVIDALIGSGPPLRRRDGGPPC